MLSNYSIIKFWLIFVISFSVNSALEFSSGNKQNTLLELFTSEGCSSCPPADKWLSLLKNNNRLFKEIIPLAFHVDYWDSLGWEDKYASKKNSMRQYQYKYLDRISSVYTPGVVENGKESRKWYYGIQNKNTNITGKLSARIDNNKLNVNFANIKKDKGIILNVAILGVDIVSEVEAGENADTTLEHDFIVLTHRQYSGNDNKTKQRWDLALPKAKISAPKYAIAIWISTVYDLKPIQATGAWL